MCKFLRSLCLLLLLLCLFLFSALPVKAGGTVVVFRNGASFSVVSSPYSAYATTFPFVSVQRAAFPFAAYSQGVVGGCNSGVSTYTVSPYQVPAPLATHTYVDAFGNIVTVDQFGRILSIR